MVAYSFKRRFVAPIKVGLHLDISSPEPKTQTIRAEGLKRHARPGEKVQLYCGMRTKACFLIGFGICTRVETITIAFRRRRRSDWLRLDGRIKLDRPNELDRFARADGFQDWADLRAFWQKEHDVADFHGVIIYWQAPEIEVPR